MHDSDGEFLLVEAANALPHWLNPENSSFRVRQDQVREKDEILLNDAGMD